MAEHTVYAVASGKGGVGKTTTTVNLGAALAEQGHSVALVDADLGMANLGGYLGVGEEGTTLHEVLGGEADLEDAIYEVGEGLAVVPSGISLNGFANVETAALSDAVDSLEGAFDYVLLDLGAGMSHDSVLPLALADAVLLVSTPNKLALQDTAKTREVTERLGGAVAGSVLTRARDPTGLDLDDVSEQIGIPVLAVIPEDQAVQEGTEAGRPVVGFDPDSPAAEGYRGLAEIVIEESLANAPVVPDHADPAGPPAAQQAPAGAAAEPDRTTDQQTDSTSDQRTDTAAEPEADAAAEPTADTAADPEADTASDPEADTASDHVSDGESTHASDAAAESVADANRDTAGEPAAGSPQDGPGPADADADEPTAAAGGQPTDESDGPSGGDSLDDRDLVPEQERDAEDIAAAIEEAASVPADAARDSDQGLTFEETDLDVGGDEPVAEDEPEPAFTVEGAEPETDDEEDEESSGGFLSRLFGG